LVEGVSNNAANEQEHRVEDKLCEVEMTELLSREDMFLILELLLAETPELSLEVYERIGDVSQEIYLYLLPNLPVLP
jgi:hypothetical protein